MARDPYKFNIKMLIGKIKKDSMYLKNEKLMEKNLKRRGKTENLPL